MTPLRLPFPPSSLFPNRRHGKHWSTIQRSKELARVDGATLAKAWARTTGFKPRADAKYGLYVLFEVARDNKDSDNMLSACKPLLDGVANGLGVNDKQFRPITIDVAKAKADSVIVTIEEWEGK
jgi:crossover junction endodeoxyribonuclease RusA